MQNAIAVVKVTLEEVLSKMVSLHWDEGADVPIYSDAERASHG